MLKAFEELDFVMRCSRRWLHEWTCHATVFIAIGLAFCSRQVFAQASAAAPAPSASITELDTYIKVFIAALTGLGTLLGLPVVWLTYRKTRAEITKLEFETNTLREKQPSQVQQSRDDEGNVRILVDRSPNTTVQVTADPRFLAPLLILLDFILAWVILTLANHLLAVFDFGIFKDVALVILAFTLLLPIARQVLRVRTVLRPQRSAEEIRASMRQIKFVVYSSYATVLLSSLIFGGFLLSMSMLTWIGRYLAWFLLALGTLLLILIPIGKPKFERYLIKLHSDNTE